VLRRIREIKDTVNLLEQQREDSLNTQWKLFLEAEELLQKKLELRADSHRIYSEIERKIFALRKDYNELTRFDRNVREEKE